MQDFNMSTENSNESRQTVSQLADNTRQPYTHTGLYSLTV